LTASPWKQATRNMREEDWKNGIYSQKAGKQESEYVKEWPYNANESIIK